MVFMKTCLILVLGLMYGSLQAACISTFAKDKVLRKVRKEISGLQLKPHYNLRNVDLHLASCLKSSHNRRATLSMDLTYRKSSKRLVFVLDNNKYHVSRSFSVIKNKGVSYGVLFQDESPIMILGMMLKSGTFHNFQNIIVNNFRDLLLASSHEIKTSVGRQQVKQSVNSPSLSSARSLAPKSLSLAPALPHQNTEVNHYQDAIKTFNSRELQQSDVDLFNKEYFAVFRNFKDDLNEEIKQKVHAAVKDMISEGQGKNIQVLELLEFQHNITDVFLGLEKVSGDTLQIVYPAGSRSNLFIKLKVRVRFKKGILRKTTNVTVTIKGLKISDIAHISPKNNGEVLVHIPNNMSVRGEVDIDVSNSVLNVIVSAIEKFFDPMTKKLKSIVSKSIKDSLNGGLEALQYRAKNVHGLSDTYSLPTSANVEEKDMIVANIEEKIFKIHLPHAMMVAPLFNRPFPLQWFDYKDIDLNSFPESDFIPHLDDGAIWTGTFLSSMALKYKHTQEPKDLEKINSLLGKIEILATINGEGPLARSAMPKNSKYAGAILNSPTGFFKEKLINGELWISYQGNGISRDQYMGIMTGLINTYHYVNDSNIKSKVRIIYNHLINYLIKNNWTIFIDSARDVNWSSKKFPTIWSGIGYQKVTYLLGAHLMNPENSLYKNEYIKNRPLLKFMWLGAFLSAAEAAEKYYGVNLFHSTLFSLVNIIDDKNWNYHIARSVNVLEHYVGHHKNSYFDTIRLHAMEKIGMNNHDFIADISSLKASINENYNSAFYRPHTINEINPEEADIAEDITYDEYVSLSNRKIQIATSPLPPRFQAQEEHFLWQRSPFYSIKDVHYLPKGTSCTGLSIHMMHWMITGLGI